MYWNKRICVLIMYTCTLAQAAYDYNSVYDKDYSDYDDNEIDAETSKYFDVLSKYSFRISILCSSITLISALSQNAKKMSFLLMAY